MNWKRTVLDWAVIFSALTLAACEQDPGREMAAERREAQEKIAKAEKEAAEKVAKARREADETAASAAKELQEKKTEIKKDLAEELADKRYEAFAAMSDYRLLVTARIDEKERRLIELKSKGAAMAATMTADAKKEWAESVRSAELKLKAARQDLRSLDTSTEKTWASTKAKVDSEVKDLARSVDDLGDKIDA
jgi:hypothetical protein